MKSYVENLVWKLIYKFRNLKLVKKILEESELDDAVVETALKVLKEIEEEKEDTPN